MIPGRDFLSLRSFNCLQPPGVFVVLRAYGDESGHFQDPHEEVIALAACIAPLEKWDAFDLQWGDMLEEFGVQELHMKEFAHSRGDFNGWKECKRRAFLESVLTIFANHVSFLAGAAFPLSDFEPESGVKSDGFTV